MNIDPRKPEEVIRPEYVQQYKSLHENIWHRLVHINTSIQILEALNDFPFHNIDASQNKVFWPMVHWNFLYTSIVMLHAIINDQTSDPLTLVHFKNKLSHEWILPAEQANFRGKLKSCKFSKEVNSIKERITTMRHKVIAHVPFGPPVSKVPGVSVPELRQFYTSAHRLFEACCFGSKFRTSLYIPDHKDEHPQTEDIDEILKLILKNSFWINKPECRADFWPDIRRQMSKEEIDELNLWRRKLGMPDA